MERSFPDPTRRRPAPWPALDHGLVGNGRISALVAPDSAVDWLALPNLDSPSIFGALLDEAAGGRFRVQHRDRALRGAMSYVPNTNVLQTRFEEDGAAWETIDFAPRLPDGWSVRLPREFVRLIRPVSGQPTLTLELDARPDYGRARAEYVESTTGVEVRWDSGRMHVASNLPAAALLSRRPFVLTRPVFVALAWGGPGDAVDIQTADQALQLTTAGWRAWARTCALPSFAPNAVLRSALCLKLHAFHDTGAVMAATTTSIPEAMGTERCWDYRFCWLRDSAFVVEALRRLSHNAEGLQFVSFLRDVAESGPLQPLYGIDGRRGLAEQTLDHLAGFGGNGHVRIGNAAALQRQNDLEGELLLCLETLVRDPRTAFPSPDSLLPLVTRLVEQAIAQAGQPDTGIWEFRTLPRHYTFSRAMCWVAIERGALLARALGAPALAERWHAIAEKERGIVLARGYNSRRGLFSQALDGENADAANLLLPTIGIIDARDPRAVSSLAVTEELLDDRGWILRYKTPDDFGKTTAAFTICSFWRAEALALSGQLQAAKELFERLLAFANPVGLFSEDVDPETGALLGNFPQAYTHVGLIHAAITIGTLLDAENGHVRAWA
jgi:GH15 family glucan-1,4-alpha-glucosidase